MNYDLQLWDFKADECSPAYEIPDKLIDRKYGRMQDFLIFLLTQQGSNYSNPFSGCLFPHMIKDSLNLSLPAIFSLAKDFILRVVNADYDPTTSLVNVELISSEVDDDKFVLNLRFIFSDQTSETAKVCFETN